MKLTLTIHFIQPHISKILLPNTCWIQRILISNFSVFLFCSKTYYIFKVWHLFLIFTEHLILDRLHLKWFRGKESAPQCRRPVFNPWVRKIPGGGNGNPLQYSCLENSMDRLQSMGLQRVRHDWATITFTFISSAP